MPNPIDLTGMRFGRLLVLRRDEIKPRTWVCLCDCSAQVTRAGRELRAGDTKSCGCLRREVTRQRYLIHGATLGKKQSPEYRIWAGMLTRCHNPHCHNFHTYGGRGIVVCDRWRRSFVNFLSDMGPKPSSQHSVDRIDTNGPYAPANCRWADRRTQANNSRHNRWITIRGQYLTIAQAARLVGIKYGTMLARVNRGYALE